ncbi:hypothetical protein F4779DRAFT_620255 [Xylariaceae sp. FL0662B]|nr:hypothetical protein F4779DRAFT_620255 [Xylariaceae sp. FL0662B]
MFPIFQVAPVATTTGVPASQTKPKLSPVTASGMPKSQPGTYVPGLPYRARGDGVEHAIAAIENTLATQMNVDHDSAWYGTFKGAPDEPVRTLGNPSYPPEIHGSYEPNGRVIGFAIAHRVKHRLSINEM